MAYGRGDIPKFKAPRLPRMPEDRRTNLAPGGPLPTKPKPKPVPKPAAKPKPKGGVPAPPEAGTPYDAYIEELRKMKGEEIARQQAEANRIRQAYAAYAAYVKDLPDRVQALYSNAGHDQAQFANGFANGLRETAAAQAAEINAQLEKIGAPEGQRIAASQGEQAGNVLYGSGGQIPANALTTSGAAFGAAAAFEGPNALKKGLLESQKYLTDNAGHISDYDLEIAKAVGDQAKYREDLRQQKLEQAAKLREAGQKAKADRLEFLQDRADKLTDQTGYIWVVKGNKIVPTKVKTLDALKFERDANKAPGSDTEIFGSDAAGRYMIDHATGKIIQLTPPIARSSGGGGSSKGRGSGGKNFSDFSTSAGVVRVYRDGRTKVIVPAGGSGGAGSAAKPLSAKDKAAAVSAARQGIREGSTWSELVQDSAEWPIDQAQALRIAAGQYGGKIVNGRFFFTLGGLRALAKKGSGGFNIVRQSAINLGFQPTGKNSANDFIKFILARQGKGSAVPSGGGQNASFSLGNSVAGAVIETARKVVGTPYVWGGESFAEGGFDCSGLLYYAFAQHGIKIPRTSQTQWQYGTRVASNDLQPGDAVFFRGYTGGKGGPGHVAIYLGNGMMLEAPHTGAQVRIVPISGRSDFMGARRFTSRSRRGQV